MQKTLTSHSRRWWAERESRKNAGAFFRRIFPSTEFFHYAGGEKRRRKSWSGGKKIKRRGKSFCLTQTTGERLSALTKEEHLHPPRLLVCVCSGVVGWTDGWVGKIRKTFRTLTISANERTRSFSMFSHLRPLGDLHAVFVCALQLQFCSFTNVYMQILGWFFLRFLCDGPRTGGGLGGWGGVAWNAKRCRAHRVSHGDAGENPTVESTSIHTQ